MAKEQLTRDDLEGFGSLITVRNKKECLGDLLNFGPKKHENAPEGVWDPTYGALPFITHEECEAHNKALDTARVEGLDKQCKVGQGGNFYLIRPDGHWRVATFIGTVIATEESIHVQGLDVSVRRKGRVFTGRRNTEDGCIFLKRTK